MTDRQHELDEQGNPIPFTDFLDYRKLEYLVPGALCRTRAGKIIEWKDARPQPTYDEIEAVLDADVEAKEEQEQEDQFEIPDRWRKAARVMYNLDKRLRVIEGKPEITFRQFVKQVKQI